jgi:hypothetical protein
MRKLLLASGIFVIALAGSASAALFSDTGNTRYETSIDLLANLGIVRGYDDGSFKPNAPVNRAELMKMLMGTAYPDAAVPTDLRCFDDFPVEIIPWYARPVCLAKGFGIVGGYSDGTFRPGNTVNFAEALKMTTLAFGSPLSPPTGGDTWYAPYIAYARSKNVLTNLLSSPAHLMTRGEIAELIVKLAPEGLLHSTASSVSSSSSSAYSSSSSSSSDGSVRHAIVNIEQKAAVTVATFPSGQQNVPLLRFTALSGRQNALLTSITFVPEIGSLLYASQYTLAMDRDGNGTYETVAQESGRTDGGKLVFDQLGTNGLLHDGVLVPFEVRANLVNTIANVSLRLGFDVTSTHYIEAVGATDGRALTGIETDGTCPVNQICWMNVVTQNSGTIDVSDQGNLFVMNDNINVQSHIDLGSALSEPVFQTTFLADQEDLDITDLRFEGGSPSIESLYLYRNGSSTAFAQATNSQCGTSTSARFCADLPSRTWILRRNEEEKLTVRAKIKSDGLGAVSGESFTITMSTSTAGYPAVEARGVTSTHELRQTDGDNVLEGEIFIGRNSPGANVPLSGKSQTVALAKISSIARGSLSVDGGVIPSGMSTLGTLELTASPHLNTYHGSNDVIIKTLTFQVLAQNVQIDPVSPRLYAEGNPSVTLSCSGSAPTGTMTITCSNIDAGPMQHVVEQGQKVRYVLQANITNPQVAVAPSILITSVPVLGDPNTSNSIIWSDEETTFTWVESTVPSLELLRYQRG